MPRVIAFDIDGTLTRKPVRDLFRSLSGGRDPVGVITARSANDTVEFIRRFNLQADFEESGPVKTVSLTQQRTAQRGFDEYVYVGNSRRDRVATKVTGWVYVDQSDSVSRLG